MDYLSLIKQPIESELADFVDLFNRSSLAGARSYSTACGQAYAPYAYFADGQEFW